MRKTRLLPVCAVLAFAAVACGAATPTDTTGPSGGPSATAPPDTNAISLVKGPVSADGLQAILATPDLATGEHRVAFVLTSRAGLVRFPSATITSLYYPPDGSTAERKQTALAVFRPWPYNTRGTYTSRLDFDGAGRWGIEIVVFDAAGARKQARLDFDVAESTQAPDVGSPAVASHNKTLNDVEDIADLTTGSNHDPDLYQTTIAEAVHSGLPTMVVMASPAFCTNAVCGPQVEVLQELKNEYKGRANFIHVDFYDNPREIQGDLDRAVVSPTVLEWDLPSTEWSFAVDRDGWVRARFESFATYEELEEALLDLL